MLSRASDDFLDDRGEGSSTETIPYIYRVRSYQDVDGDGEAVHKESIADDREQDYDLTSSASPGTSDKDRSDDSLLQMLVLRSNVFFDKDFGCTRFEKHFVLASAIEDLRYEFSETKDFFYITGYLGPVCTNHVLFFSLLRIELTIRRTNNTSSSRNLEIE